MDVNKIKPARAMLAGAFAELDCKVAMVRTLGYPMPEGNTRRTNAELDLLSLASDVVDAERKVALVQDGLGVSVFTGGQAIATDADYWQAEIARHRQALAEAVAGAVADLDRTVAMVRELGYPMPEDTARRTGAEVDLLSLASTVVDAERKLALVEDGDEVLAYTGGQMTPTDADYWTAEITCRQQKLAEAVTGAARRRGGGR
ncbi:hypothetical protein [Kutzneria sp. 744]|uniref:hypothetical protein n=1 Tax=Kutzneria sp. (strain 744) TaxID=345341 RepID=UPI0003EED02E|nr:hypothetical protein [Kutzneria sp. 744]EWM19727.1 LigA protein [Kutzneria sp. 744]